LSLLQWDDHIDFGKNIGPRRPLVNRSDKKNDDCGLSAARHQRLRRLKTETCGDGKRPPYVNLLASKQTSLESYQPSVAPLLPGVDRPSVTGATTSGEDRPVDPAPLA
jgi:hypothetical protein